ncbi:MAG: GNAT family protein [Candidatus Chryseobacterium colombiense]|nr:GNAT family protein [Chryseobacterium sp.]WEK71186.1 MAG: GNAT family protein [Chryseobacterium sp.]
MIIETSRLKIIPLSYNQLLNYTFPNQLESSLGLIENGRLVSSKVTKKIKEQILPKIAVESQDNLFITFWIIILKSENVMSAEFCFKGKPDDNDTAEIGYATFTNFQNLGIMTETIKAITGWIFENTCVKTIVAETDPNNYSSHRTLEKNNFRRVKENPDNWIWKLEKQ